MMSRRQRKTRSASRARPLAVCYVRVSTEEQADEGASLAAQESALRARADREGWDVLVLIDAGISGKSLDRARITAARFLLANGDADVLLATALDRISRSVHDVTGLMQDSVAEGWALVTIREQIDTSSAMGRAYVQIAAVFAELERGLISERVKAGMAQKRIEGVHTGRRTALPAELIARVRQMRNAGSTWQSIADTLNVESVRTATGRQPWRVSGVQSAYRSNPTPMN